jgi:hypothetical protein
MAKTNEVAVKAETAVALADEQYSQDAGSGFEETSQESYAIPFLSILQSGSPQVKKSDGSYIKGAEEGMLFNSVTQDCFGDEGVLIIPCHYTQRFIEWGLRESGGGFFGEHSPNDPLVSQTERDDKGRNMLPNGHQLSDTRNHYVLISHNGQLSPAIMSLSSSQIKASKTWMSMMQGQKEKNPVSGMYETAPMFSRYYRVKTVAQSNDKGSWFGYKFELGDKIPSDSAEYLEAKAFNHTVKSGLAKVERNMNVESPSNEKEKF